MSSEDETRNGSGSPETPETPAPQGPPDPAKPSVPDWAARVHPDLPGTPEGVAEVPAAAPPKPPPAPAKPAGPRVERREFLNWLALGWIAFSAATAASLTAMGRYFFPNVLFEPPSVFKVGFPEDFADGVVDTRFKEKYRVWVVREGPVLYVLLARCTHLGCTPNWLEAENKFKCPCHGSGYYKSGINFEGPAPRPLERLKVGLADDGQIIVDKNVVFQQEKGQWTDPASFLEV
jgi:cytochrome b6-f complex iron-sulfur subunit